MTNIIECKMSRDGEVIILTIGQHDAGMIDLDTKSLIIYNRFADGCNHGPHPMNDCRDGLLLACYLTSSMPSWDAIAICSEKDEDLAACSR